MVMKQEVLVGLKPTNKGKTVRTEPAVPSDNQLILRTNSCICPCLWIVKRNAMFHHFISQTLRWRHEIQGNHTLLRSGNALKYCTKKSRTAAKSFAQSCFL